MTTIVPEVRERLGVRSGIAVPIVDSEKDVIAFFEVYNKGGSTGFTLPVSSIVLRLRKSHHSPSTIACCTKTSQRWPRKSVSNRYERFRSDS